jgi:hypothetical protein
VGRQYRDRNVFGDAGSLPEAYRFVLGVLCLKQHGSTLGLKSQTDPTLDRQLLFLYLCGEGAGGALAPSR